MGSSWYWKDSNYIANGHLNGSPKVVSISQVISLKEAREAMPAR